MALPSELSTLNRVIFQSVQNFSRGNTLKHCIYSHKFAQSKQSNFLTVLASYYLLYKLDVNVPSVPRNLDSFVVSYTSSQASQASFSNLDLIGEMIRG